MSDPLARRTYQEKVGNKAILEGFDLYFLPPESLQEGNPQRILDRHEPTNLPPILLLQGAADGNGPEMQERFAASYRAAGGNIQLELFPGAPHNFINSAGPNFDRAVRLIKAFIEQQLGAQ
jgi:acetyl esterase/lipase